MFDKDTNQKTRAPRRGEPITAADMQKIVALILQTVKGGDGILVQRVGQSVIIKQKTGSSIGSGGGFSVATVLELPEIPDNVYRKVFWTSAGAGNGDDQLWEVYAGQTAWTPCQKFTSLSGVPI